MARKSNRRTPTQSRSKESVDAIVEACAQVLEQDGWEAVTTNRIAERAGVSVGTLYQYFENREAVLDALRKRLMAEQLAAVGDVMELLVEDRPSTEIAVEQLLDGVFRLVSIRPRLLQRLQNEVPQTAYNPMVRIWKDQANQLVRALLYEGSDRVRPGSVDIMATVLVSSIFGILTDVITLRPELLRTPELRAEIKVLVMHYVQPDAA